MGTRMDGDVSTPPQTPYEEDYIETKLCQNFKHLNICEESGVEFQVLPLPLKTSDKRLGLPGYRGT